MPTASSAGVHAFVSSWESPGAGDPDQVGLLEEGEVVFQVPVFDDSAACADVLDVDGVEIDGLAAAVDAVVGTGEMPLEDQSGSEGVSGDVEVCQLTGQVGHCGPKRRRGGARPGRALGSRGRQGVVLEVGGNGLI